MRIVVTGASGNLGSALLRAATRPGAPASVTEIVGVARRIPPRTPSDTPVSWVKCDVGARDATSVLTKAMEGADAVVHLAWAIMPGHDRQLLVRTNLLGTRAVIAAAEAAGVRHLVHASSIGAYSAGPKDRLVKEDWPTDGIPSSHYSRDKVATERLLDAAERRGVLPVVSRVRPALVVQRGAASELLRYFLPALARPLARFPLPVLPLPDSTVTQVVHADDVADGVLRILAFGAGGGRIAGRPAGSGAFNLAALPPLHPKDIAAAFGGRHVSLPAGLLRAGAAASWVARLQPVDAGWVDMLLNHPLLDAGRARQELGWEPRYSTEEALADVVSGIRAAAGDRGPLLRPLRLVS